MHSAGMIYGYARVSTDSQVLTGQLAQLKAAGCEKVFREKVTDTTADRPQLRKLTAALTHGDVVTIPAVDRLLRPVAPAPMPRHHRGEGGEAALALDCRPIRVHPPLLAACLHFAHSRICGRHHFSSAVKTPSQFCGGASIWNCAIRRR
jgi:hypothetical protein